MIRRWLDRALDNTFWVQLIALIFLTVLIAGAGTLAAMFILGKTDIGDASWFSWIRVIDPSVLQTDGPDQNNMSRTWIAISATIVILGWIVFGLLISIITTAFQERLEQIKQGTTELHVSDHTIVLGWNSTVFAVIDQLASDDEHAASEIVVLSDLEVSDMREEAKRYCQAKSLLRTHFRQGEISSVSTIRELKIRDARQVIILGPEDETGVNLPGRTVSQASSHVLKAVLACAQAYPPGKNKRDSYRMPVVAMVDTARAARAVELGAPLSVKDRFLIRAIHSSDFLARLTAQIAAEPTLARVYNELLCYEGSIVEGIDTSSEIYVVEVDKKMLGLTFDQCLMGYEKAIPFGYVAGERTVINPKPNTAHAAYQFNKGDCVIALANRKADVVWRGPKQMPDARYTASEIQRKPWRLLVLGEGMKVRRILEKLPHYLPDGSTIATNVMTDGIDPGKCTFERPDEKAQMAQQSTAAPGAFTMMAMSPSITYDRIVLVDDTRDATRHDARILMDLANIHAAAPYQKIASSVVIELLDHRNVELARAYGNMAAVVSSQLASNYLVQLGVEPRRASVYDELLRPEGNEIHVRPVATLTRSPEEPVSFNELLARSRAGGAVLLGYLPDGDRPEQLLPTEREEKHAASQYGTLVLVSED